MVFVLSAFCRVLTSLCDRCWNEIYYWNTSQPASSLAMGRLGICLGRQNFKGRQVLKNLSWVLSTFLAFDEHFDGCFQRHFLCPKYTNYRYAFVAAAPPGTLLGELTALPRPPSWQCRINHCAGFTMGGCPAASGPPINCHFLPCCLMSERREDVHKPQVSCRPTRNVWFKR